jgi:sterol desaturase/sphingolipid hydroxylase (fatty acid hydroxylase superfamily)
MYYLISTYAPLLWDTWLGQYRLIDGTDWPFYVAAPLALLTLQLGIYAWHRTMHATPFLWRWLHQTHHSAERVDIWGALYFHPMDVVGFAFVGSLALTLVLGVSHEAILFAFIVSSFCGLFQHANIRTPRWLGYFIMRPENHSIHHERGVHQHNYGDLPFWDMVFGTFRNPKTWEGEAGLIDGGSEQYLALLTGRDLTEMPAEDAATPAGAAIEISPIL